MNSSQLILLAAALSLDALAAGFLYGTDRVRIPLCSLAIISGLSAGILALFLLFGSWLQAFLPPELPSVLCFVILLCLGGLKLFDSTVKSLIRRCSGKETRITLSLSHLTLLLTIYADPAAANGPDTSVLSPAEAFSLGIALALDSAAAGVGAGMTSLKLSASFLLAFCFTAAALCAGCFLGRRLAKHMPFDLSWLAGCLLLILACLKRP